MTDLHEIVQMSERLKKPSREDRKKARIDTSELPLAKRHFTRDSDYRAWIAKTHTCLLPNHDGRRCGRIGPRNPIEAAHLEHGGKGIKGSDVSVIPLCPVHHDMLDAETLPWQIVAFLWMKALFLREQWHQMKGSE